LQVHTNYADAAAALVSFWKQPAHAKLLRRPVPVKVTKQQVSYIYHSIDHIRDLGRAMLKAEAMRQQLQKEGLVTLSEQLLLESTFAAQPVATLARLLVWMQQRPELLHLPNLDAQLASEKGRRSSSSTEATVLPYTVLWQFSAKGGTFEPYI
jgi:hypothetical protein